MKFDKFDKNEIANILKNVSNATNVYVNIVDESGEFVLTEDIFDIQIFCKCIQSNNIMKNQCKEIYTKAHKECGKWNEPYFFRCHGGLVIWAIPLKLDNKHIASIVCGQVVLWNIEEFFLEEIKNSNTSLSNVELEIIRKNAMYIKKIEPLESQSIASLLMIISKYITKSDESKLINEKKTEIWKNNKAKEVSENKKKECSYDTYIAKEKILLKYIRLGDKKKIELFIPVIFNEIENLSLYDVNKIKNIVEELMVLVSRAFRESGVKSEIVVDVLRNFKINIKNKSTSEEIFISLKESILSLIDMTYILTNNNHVSVLNTVKDYINNNYKSKITTEELAKRVYISTPYLCYLFKEKLDCTISDYITRVRIEKSIELMSKRELNVSQIMNEVGFSSQSHFTKTFKKIVGVTPGQYRNKFL